MKLQIIVIFLVCCFSYRLAATEYIINLPKPIENTPASVKMQLFFKHVYKEINIEPAYIFTSVARGFKSMSDGEIHAEGYRAEIIGDDFGKKFKIDFSLAEVKIALFCITRKLCELNSAHTYAIQHGFKYGLKVCENLNIKCKFASSSEGIAKMLDKNIVDAVISPYPAYKHYLCKSINKTFYYQNIPEYFFNIYHFTNIDNKQLREKLKQSLKNKILNNRSLFRHYSSTPNLDDCKKQLLELKGK